MAKPRRPGLQIALVIALVVALAPATFPQQSGSMRDKLIGAWKLVSLEEAGPDGKMQKLDRKGILAYTADGHMSVQIFGPQSAPAEGGPVQYEKDGYHAYFGRYTVDEKASSVTHHVEGALVRTLIGQHLTRFYKLSGKQLILKSSRPDEHWTIVWEHY